MNSRTVSALAALVVVTVAVGAAAARQVSPVPRPGTGAVMVEGDVSVKGDVRVVNDLDVAARQSGAWKVGVDGVVTTTSPALPFVRVGGTYQIRWAEHVYDVVVVRETHGSWVRAETTGSSTTKWINLSTVWSIAEQRPR